MLTLDLESTGEARMRRPGKSFSDVCGDGNEHGVRDWLDWIHEKPERVQHLNVGLSNGLKALEGYSGLMMAIRGGHMSIVRLLVKEPGLDFDHVADDGATALHVAVGSWNGQLEWWEAQLTGVATRWLWTFFLLCLEGRST